MCIRHMQSTMVGFDGAGADLVTNCEIPERTGWQEDPASNFVCEDLLTVLCAVLCVQKDTV